MELTHRQLEATRHVNNPDVSFVLYGGAIRGAKTWWLAILFFTLAKLYPNSRWVIVRRDYQRIEKNLLPSITTVALRSEFRPYFLKGNKMYNKTTHTFHFKNGSQVILFPELSERDPDQHRFAGLEANGIAFDELNECLHKTFQKAFERAGAWLNAGFSVHGFKPRNFVIATCNPSKNWVKELIYDRWLNLSLPWELKRGDKTDLPDNWKYVQSRITDNPYMTDEYYQSLRQNMSYVRYQRYVNGDWDIDDQNGDEWVYNFRGEEHVFPCPPMPKQPFHVSWDFNVVPYMTTLVIQLARTQNNGWRIMVVDEICGKNKAATIVAQATTLVNRYLSEKPTIYIYGDAQGNNRMEGYLTTRFDDVKKALSPYRHNGWSKTNTHNGDVNISRDFINAILDNQLNMELRIDPRCKNLIQDLIHLKEGPEGYVVEYEKLPGGKGRAEKYGHCYDALVYFLMYNFKGLYETYLKRQPFISNDTP